MARELNRRLRGTPEGLDIPTKIEARWKWRLWKGGKVPVYRMVAMCGHCDAPIVHGENGNIVFVAGWEEQRGIWRLTEHAVGRVKHGDRIGPRRGTATPNGEIWWVGDNRNTKQFAKCPRCAWVNRIETPPDAPGIDMD